MDLFVKYQSRQGGAFTAQQNLVDFTVPMSGVYDLSDSFIQLNYDLDVTEADTAGGQGVYDFNIQWVTADADKPHFDNVAVVKNASIDCSSKGRIENIRRVDQLRQNMAYYDKTRMEGIDEAYLNVNQIRSPIGSEIKGMSRQFNKLGSVKSDQVAPAPLQVRLSDIWEFCRAPEYDTDKAGETHLHLELNIDKLEAGNFDQSGEVNVGLRNFINNTTQGAGNNAIVVGDKGGTTVTKFTSLQQSPYYVGQKVKITATGAGGAGNIAAVPSVISSIDWNRTTGALTLSFEADWGAALAAGQSYTDIEILNFSTAAAVISFSSAELVLKRKSQPEGLGQIQYNTYSTEETNGNGLTNFTNLYTVEPEANAVVIFTPEGADGLLSHNANFTKYRLRLNNEDLTDRDVDKNSPLYYDRTAMTLNAMGSGLSNTLQSAGVSNANTWTNTYNKANTQLNFIGNPLFQTASTKLLQVNIEAAATGVRQLSIFKQLPRVFSY
jgi:hypothetical protein